MKRHKILDIQLVVTVALKKEIPEKWMSSYLMPVYTLAALKSGAISRTNVFHSGIFILITGSGIKASEEAACWIRDNLNPLFVINIGTCGLTKKKYPLGAWIKPQYVFNENGDQLELDQRSPVPEPENVIKVHSLISVKTVILDNTQQSWKVHDAVDMECYAQAKVFRESDITFHCLKFSTDYSDYNTASDFNHNLIAFSKQIKTLFSFIISNNPRITAIVPVYNREQTIRRAIDSILVQSHMPEEIIVVDDGSTDKTKEILKSYGDKLTSISLPRNSGVSRARNTGIYHARTEWLAFMDSDDCWKKNKLKNQITYIRKYPFYQIMQSEEVWIRNGVRVNPRRHHKKPLGWIWEKSLERCLVSPSGVIVKKKLLERYGNFDESLPVCEDYDLWLKISRHHPVGLDLNLSVVKYGGHKDQLSRKYHTMDLFRVRSLVKFLENESIPHFKERIIKVLTKKLNILIKGYQKRQKFKKAHECGDMLTLLEKYSINPNNADIAQENI